MDLPKSFFMSRISLSLLRSSLPDCLGTAVKQHRLWLHTRKSTSLFERTARSQCGELAIVTVVEVLLVRILPLTFFQGANMRGVSVLPELTGVALGCVRATINLSH
jgi:hypothetical protein